MGSPSVLIALGPRPEPALAAARAALRAGDVVALPTDTVYGLAVAAAVPGAWRKLLVVKGRPAEAQLPVLVADRDQAAALVELGWPGLEPLLDDCWPGALTIVAPRRPGAAVDLESPDDTLGVRCPDDDFVRQLAATIGPLVTTSANRHGRPPFATAAEVEAGLEGVALVVDGGARSGAASTVLSIVGGRPRILRAGAISSDRIAAILPTI